MLRYGQIVKLKNPQTIKVLERFKILRAELSTTYKSKIIEVPSKRDDNDAPMFGYTLRDKGGYKDFIFDIPKGELCVLGYVHISPKYNIVRVFIPNPITQRIGRNLGLSVSTEDISTTISKKEKNSMRKVQTDFMLSKLHGDNLSLIEQIDEVQ